jgi:hypothetical protein
MEGCQRTFDIWQANFKLAARLARNLKVSRKPVNSDLPAAHTCPNDGIHGTDIFIGYVTFS